MNANYEMNTNHETNPEGEDLKLKAAAERYKCRVFSLRSGIKNGKLPAYQSGSKAVYYMKAVDVERFLKESPGIASKFHPKNGPAEQAPHPEEGSSRATEGAKAKKTPAPKKNEPQNSRPIQTANDSGADKDTPSRRRRNRRRGRGRSGAGSPAGAHRNQILKALDGTTDQERLRIIACLNELTAIVASA